LLKLADCVCASVSDSKPRGRSFSHRGSRGRGRQSKKDTKVTLRCLFFTQKHASEMNSFKTH